MISRYIPIETFIAGVQDDLGFTRGIGVGRFKRWAYKAISQLEISSTITKTEIIDIKDLTAAKPADMVIPDRLYLMGRAGDCTEPFCGNIVRCCEDSDDCNPKFIVDEDQDKFIFSSNVAGNFDRLKLIYHACPVDDNGDPLVPEEFAEAIYRFVGYKHLERVRNQNRSVGGRSNPVPVSELRAARNDWLISARGVVGEMTKPSSFRQLLEAMDKVTYEVSNVFPPRLKRATSSYYNKCSC